MLVCFLDHHLPSSFQNGLSDQHLFFNHCKSLLLISDLGQMRDCSFKGEPGITDSLNQETEMRISVYQLENKSVFHPG